MRARTFRAELETLSPAMVTAGPDARLSPYTDFVQEGDHLVYLDPLKLERLLAARGGQVMDEFVRGVRTGMDNTRSNFELSDFIRNRLGSTPGALALRRVPVTGRVRHNHVRRHLANGGQPYVPGSTLKGAIRTAIMYGWLLGEENGREFVGRLAAAAERLWGELHGQLEQAEQHYRDAQEAHQADDGKTRDRLKGEGTRLAEPVRRRTEEAFREFGEESLFGRLSDRHEGAEMRFLRVSDTAPVSPGMLRVMRVARVKLGDASTVSPQWSEVLPRGIRSSFTLTIEPRFTRPDLRFLNDLSLESLLDRLYQFAADALEWECDALPEDEAYRDVYDLLLGVAERDLPLHAALLRLGGGKTYFDNSVGLALYRHNPPIFEHFRRLLGLGRNPQTRQFSGKRFPATRSYVVREAGNRLTPIEPLGWVQFRVVG